MTCDECGHRHGAPEGHDAASSAIYGDSDDELPGLATPSEDGSHAEAAADSNAAGGTGPTASGLSGVRGATTIVLTACVLAMVASLALGLPPWRIVTHPGAIVQKLRAVGAGREALALRPTAMLGNAIGFARSVDIVSEETAEKLRRCGG